MENNFRLDKLKTIDLIFLTREALMNLFINKYQWISLSKDILSIRFNTEEKFLNSEVRLDGEYDLSIDFYYKDIDKQLIRNFDKGIIDKLKEQGIDFYLYGGEVLQILKPVVDVIVKTKIKSEKGDYNIEWNPITNYNGELFLKYFTTWANICIPHKLGKKSYD